MCCKVKSNELSHYLETVDASIRQFKDTYN
jgi:hypothetical protein